MKLFEYEVETTVSQTLFREDREKCLNRHRRAIGDCFYCISITKDSTKELTIDIDNMDTSFHHDVDTVTLRSKVHVTIEDEVSEDE